MQTRIVQPGKSYTSVTRTESRQPIKSRQAKIITKQEKMVSPSPDQLVADTIQKLQHHIKEHMEKTGAMFKSLVTLVTKITQSSHIKLQLGMPRGWLNIRKKLKLLFSVKT
jgi:hypothetical protein